MWNGKSHPMNPSDIDLSDPEFWNQPLDARDRAFDVLRKQKPVSWQAPPLAFAPDGRRPPRGYWAITCHADIRRVQRDSRTFSATTGTFLFDNMSPEDEYAAAGMMGTDPPRHRQLRALVESAFTARTLARIRTQTEMRAYQLVAAVAPLGSCDFKQIVDPLPRLAVCDLLGIPESDRAEIARLVHLQTAGSGDGYDTALQAARDIARYAIELARIRAINPQDDLITLLVNAEVEGERFAEPDLGAMANLLIVAGLDTTAATLQLMLLAFDDFPQERARLMEDFDRYAPTAIEEILRWATPGTHIRRVATEETTIGDQKIARGDNVVLWFRSGNRDESAFADPYKFDIARSPNPHIAFGGGGRHFCLGNELARMEIRAMLAALFKYLPDIHHLGTPRYHPTPQYILVDGPLPCAYTACQVP
jgi:cytochrome P450